MFESVGMYMEFFGAQGHVPPSDWSDPTGILNFSRFYALLVTSKFDEDPIKNERSIFGTGNINGLWVHLVQKFYKN